MRKPTLTGDNPTALHLIIKSLFVAILMFSLGANAVTIVSGPSFVPSVKAPLAGVLTVSTDIGSRVSVSVNDGTNSWEKDFYDFSTSHSMTLLGFKPGRTNQISVTVYDKYRNACSAPQTLTFVTPPLPIDISHSVVRKSEPDLMEPGYMLFLMQLVGTTSHYIMIVNSAGEVVWYTLAPAAGDVDVRQLDNGDLFLPEMKPNNDFVELNMLGTNVQTWHPPAQYPVNVHEGLVTDHGTILYLSDASVSVSNFPTTVTSNATLATKLVDDNPIVEISMTNSILLNAWSPIGLIAPTRVTYLTYQLPNTFGVDNEHANAVVEDTTDDSIVFSLRDQNAVFKLSRATSRLKWILGTPTNWPANFQQYLFTPVGSPFAWQYGQHAPKVTPQHTVLLYDDGNSRASPFDPPLADQSNHSRAVEYAIDETNMLISQLWDSTQANEDRFFTQYLGDAVWLPQQQNILVTYGNINYVNGAPPSPTSTSATMVRIVEYTHDPVPQVLFDMEFFDHSNTSSTYKGYVCYRCIQIPDLYPHTAQPVTSLVLNFEDSVPDIQFSADPAHNYLIQASTDLQSWTDVGSPENDGSGNFDFVDVEADQFQARFYRVVTQ